MPAHRLALVPDPETAKEAATGLRIAFASTDRTSVDQHFGSATSFMVYAVDAGASRFVEALRFTPAAQDGDEGKLVARIAALEGCAAVYVQAVGSSAASQLIRAGVHPQKVASGALIAPLLAALQRQLAEEPPAWAQKALAAEKRADRFDAMEAEDWDE
ncbi:MAG: nitrogen fixation protein NifX [Pseudomonadota bacterium]